MPSVIARARSWASPIVKPPLRRVRYRLADLVDRRHPSGVEGVPLPPRLLRNLNGPEDFLSMGASIAADIVAQTGMAAGDDVLDAGCGCGRVAIPLVEVLGPDGSYEGFDVVPEAIAWCTRRITSAHPNFRFRLADVYSHHYHRKGRQTAAHYRFPYEDGTFDVVFLTSIFTHLGAAATEKYLRESARVLRPGGRLFASFFLLDDVAREAMAAGRAARFFEAKGDGAFTANLRDPDAAVAHDDAVVRAVLDSAGLELDGEPRWGSWAGRPETTRHQDVVVAVRTPRTPRTPRT